MDLTTVGNSELRSAIRGNLVSFPAQVPVFRNRPRVDIQARVAVLYFIRGWPFERIGARYHVSRVRAGQIARDWRLSSVQTGYIQEIPPNP